MNKVKFISLAAGVSLALAFIFSCGLTGELGDGLSSSANNSGNGLSSSAGGTGGTSSSIGGTGGSSSSSNGSSDGTSSSSIGGIDGSSSSSDGTCETGSGDKFCYEGELYDFCNGRRYVPTEQDCCYSNAFGSRIYTLSTHSCERGRVSSKCGDYDTSAQFCSSGTLKDKGEFTDERDGKKYKYVEIGSQTWMAENLNYDTETNGSKCYNNLETNCATFGRLYHWAAAMDIEDWYKHNFFEASTNYRGICPEGWHIPNNAEWETLINFVSSESVMSILYRVVGYELKTISGWKSGTVDNSYGGGMDNYGFSALPGGWGISEDDIPSEQGGGSFAAFGQNGYWWSATEFGRAEPNDAYHLRLDSRSDGANFGITRKFSLLSVRCVKD